MAASQLVTAPVQLLLEALAGTVVAWLAVQQRLVLMRLASTGSVGDGAGSGAGAAQHAAASSATDTAPGA